MIYRVIMKLSYSTTMFDFNDSLTAVNFMSVAMSHLNPDAECKLYMSLEVVPIKEEPFEEEEF